MKNLICIFCLIAFFMFSCSSTKNINPQELYAEVNKNAPVNTLTEQESRNGWELLFNGNDFSGWHGYNMDFVPDFWIIEDQAMTMTTTGGGESQDVITDKIYDNFALNLEYRLTEGANSGIIYHVKEDSMYKFPYETGAEYQIIDEEGWPGGLEDWQISGANYAMHPPETRPYKPVGEWNHALLVVNGNKVTHMLNGEVLVEFEKYTEEWTKLRNSGKWNDFPDYGKFDKGHISLQNHGTKVWFRNVKIKEL
jgi:hypothetical protein